MIVGGKGRGARTSGVQHETDLGVCLLGGNRLDEQMELFRAAVASQHSDRLRRARLLSKVEAIAKQLLGPDVEVLGYGSCFTGVGESDAEVDATVYIPMTPSRAADVKTVTVTRAQQMRRILARCSQLGMRTADNLGARTARSASIEEFASVHLSGNLWRAYSAGRCILSCQRLMPLYSSHLIRARLSSESLGRRVVSCAVRLCWLYKSG